MTIRRKVKSKHKMYYYLYVGGMFDGWYTPSELARITESLDTCTLTAQQLSGRLGCAYRNQSGSVFKTVWDAMTMPKKMAIQKDNNLTRSQKNNLLDIEERNIYINILNLMPIGSLAGTVR